MKLPSNTAALGPDVRRSEPLPLTYGPEMCGVLVNCIRFANISTINSLLILISI